MKTYQVSEPTNIRIWQRFPDLYHSFYEADRATFYTKVNNNHTLRVTSTLAETLFSIDGSRLLLPRMLGDLLSQRAILCPSPILLPILL